MARAHPMSIINNPAGTGGQARMRAGNDTKKLHKSCSFKDNAWRASLPMRLETSPATQCRQTSSIHARSGKHLRACPIITNNPFCCKAFSIPCIPANPPRPASVFRRKANWRCAEPMKRAIRAVNMLQQCLHFQGGIGRRRIGPATAAAPEEEGAPEGRPVSRGV